VLEVNEMMNATDRPGRLVSMPDDECWRLLAAGSVGRISWIRGDRPFVVPVNFAVDGTRIHLRTSAYSALAQEVDSAQVAFQVDDIDATTQSGWTVVAQGRAEVRLPGAMSDPGLFIDVWPTGPKTLSIVIEVAEISGRQLTCSH
jgi:hypothetical protein